MKKWGNKIVRIVKADVDNFTVKLKFSDEEIFIISLSHIFSTPKGCASEVLRGELFERCYLQNGALAWPNGFELCPDALRQWAMEQAGKKKVA